MFQYNMMERGLKHQQIWNDGVAVAGSYRPQVYIICMWRIQLQKCMWRIQLQKCIVGDALSFDAPTIAAMDLILPGLFAGKLKHSQQNKKKRTEIDDSVYINVIGGSNALKNTCVTFAMLERPPYFDILCINYLI